MPAKQYTLEELRQGFVDGTLDLYKNDTFVYVRKGTRRLSHLMWMERGRSTMSGVHLWGCIEFYQWLKDGDFKDEYAIKYWQSRRVTGAKTSDLRFELRPLEPNTKYPM